MYVRKRSSWQKHQTEKIKAIAFLARAVIQGIPRSRLHLYLREQTSIFMTAQEVEVLLELPLYQVSRRAWLRQYKEAEQSRDILMSEAEDEEDAVRIKLVNWIRDIRNKEAFIARVIQDENQDIGNKLKAISLHEQMIKDRKVETAFTTFKRAAEDQVQTLIGHGFEREEAISVISSQLQCDPAKQEMFLMAMGRISGPGQPLSLPEPPCWQDQE